MHEIDKQQFGAFVAQLRKEQGLTQKELAARLFISDKAVSKWETGVSIPDVALLIPLSKELKVTVSELLECRRMEPRETAQVEELVQKAIRYSGEELPPQNRTRNGLIFLACVLVTGLELLFLHLNGFPANTWSVYLQMTTLFGIIFGGYFMVFAQSRLPKYYDENKIYGMHQGFFRMNVPGLSFNNSNWPHLLRVGRIWSMVLLVAYPPVYYLMCRFAPAFWQVWENPIMLTLILGGLFVPMYVVGKKYE